METRVKERLTGAVILVTLIVLLVPELLTGHGRSASVATTSQAGEPAMRSYTIDLAEGGMRQRATPVALPSPKEEAPALEAKVLPRETAPALQSNENKAQATEERRASAPVPPPARVAKAEPPPVTGWSIQLGSFVSRDNAQRLVRELNRKGFSAFMLEGGGTSGKLYRVRVGPASDRAAATALAAKLRQAGQPGSIVPHP